MKIFFQKKYEEFLLFSENKLASIRTYIPPSQYIIIQ